VIIRSNRNKSLLPLLRKWYVCAGTWLQPNDGPVYYYCYSDGCFHSKSRPWQIDK